MSEILVIIRPSFMKFCQDGCRAALFNHILYWIAKKAKGQPQEKIQAGEITYYATTEELTEQMAGAWGYQKVRREVNELIDVGLVGRGKNPTWGVDRTKHFFFGKEQYEKLIKLCQKYEINLSKIGLPSEVTELIKQFTNQSNANDQSVNCLCSGQFTDQSAAIYQSVGTITKDTTKDSFTKDERKNEATQQKANVSTQDEDDSFSHSLSQNKSSSLSSQETKPEVVFSPEEEAIYTLADKLNLSVLKRDTNHKEHCSKLIAKGITTQEQMENLLAFTQRKLSSKGAVDLCLGNLVREANGWLQLQAKPKACTVGETANRPYRDAAAESLAKQDEVMKRILEKQGKEKAEGRQVPVRKPSEMLKEAMAKAAREQRAQDPLPRR